MVEATWRAWGQGMHCTGQGRKVARKSEVRNPHSKSRTAVGVGVAHMSQMTTENELEGAVAAMKLALTCQSCRRCPSSCGQCVPRSEYAGGAPSDLFYDGALLVSPSCGHFFCGDCWSDCARDINVGGDIRQCPCCKQPASIEPMPVVTFLRSNCEGMGEKVNSSSQHGVRANDSACERPHGLQDRSSGSFGDLLQLLGMLRQFSGSVLPMAASEEDLTRKTLQRQEDEEDNSGLGSVARPAGDGSDPDEASRNYGETEVPSSCIPIDNPPDDYQLQQSMESDSDSSSEHHAEDGRVLSECITAKRSTDAEESPTVLQSQLSSRCFSSIKSGKKIQQDGYDLNQMGSLDELEEDLLETEVPATCIGINLAVEYNKSAAAEATAMSCGLKDESDAEGTTEPQFKSDEEVSKESQGTSTTKLTRHITSSRHKRQRTTRDQIEIITAPPSGLKEIRPWNIHSQALSPMTCEKPLTPPPMPLFVAVDILDEDECRDIGWMQIQGMCELVLDKVSLQKNSTPFPAILLTHTMEVPAPRGNADDVILVCYRTCHYLHARICGATIVDADWATESKEVEAAKDVQEFSVWGDMESYQLMKNEQMKPCWDSPQIGAISEMLRSELRDYTLGLLMGQGRHERQCEEENTFKQQFMTREEMTSIVECWGGQIGTIPDADLLLVDSHATLDEVVEALQRELDCGCDWTLEKATKSELASYVLADAPESQYTNNRRSDDTSLRIPLVSGKWLEDSICLAEIRLLDDYCQAILCLHLNEI